jgi:hypothetical protein
MRSWIPAVVGTILLAGCGGSGSPFETVPVSGKVSYEDGSTIPVPGMKLFFHPLVEPKDGKTPRNGQADVGPDGTFSNVTTMKYGDGLLIGKYSVALNCLEDGKPSKKIPSDYVFAAKTPLVVEVTSSGQVLEIKVPKPKN